MHVSRETYKWCCEIPLDFHFHGRIIFVILTMLSPSQKSVSRETSKVSDVLELFRADPDFMKGISLLKHRDSLVLSTTNSTFVLFWLKMLRDQGYFPLVVFDKESDAESFYADALGLFTPGKLSWIPLFLK